MVYLSNNNDNDNTHIAAVYVCPGTGCTAERPPAPGTLVAAPGQAGHAAQAHGPGVQHGGPVI